MAREVYFEQVVAKGFGLDVHKDTVVANVSGTAIKTETRTFSTFTCALTELREWLLSIYCVNTNVIHNHGEQILHQTI